MKCARKKVPEAKSVVRDEEIVRKMKNPIKLKSTLQSVKANLI